MPDQNPLAKENHLKVEVMFVSFALWNLDARKEISLLTLGNVLLLRSFVSLQQAWTVSNNETQSEELSCN